jgi:hypothetical protein
MNAHITDGMGQCLMRPVTGEQGPVAGLVTSSRRLCRVHGQRSTALLGVDQLQQSNQKREVPSRSGPSIFIYVVGSISGVRK